MNVLSDFEQTKKIGIVVHSYEGGALCFLEACRQGAKLMRAHWHPTVLLSAIPMGLSMPAWEANDYIGVQKYLREGIEQVAQSGADFFICPDNTAHIVLEQLSASVSIPGLHIADVVCEEIKAKGWKRIGLLGTKWTMSGPVYTKAFEKYGIEKVIPKQESRKIINEAIFEELCQGIFKPETIKHFVDAIDYLKEQGAEGVILGCTEIPLIISQDNSSLPVLDSTRLLAKYAVKCALSKEDLKGKGWINPSFA